MSIHQFPLNPTGKFDPFEDIILAGMTTQEISALYREAQRGWASISLGSIRDRIAEYGGEDRARAMFDWEAENIEWGEIDEPPVWPRDDEGPEPPEGWDSA